MTFRDSTERAAGSDFLAVLGRLGGVVAGGVSIAVFMLGLHIVRDLEEARVNNEARIVTLEEKALTNKSRLEALSARVSASETLAAGIGARIDAQGRTLDRIERLLERQSQP